jgi:hypothetical protein
MKLGGAFFIGDYMVENWMYILDVAGFISTITLLIVAINILLKFEKFRNLEKRVAFLEDTLNGGG